MVKRLLSCDAVDFERMSKEELLTAIQASEGRTIMAEVNGNVSPTPFNLTNAEIARAFSADLILLNKCDLNHLTIGDLPETDQPIRLLKKLTGRPIGVNLEPIDLSQETSHDRSDIAEGRKATEENFIKLKEFGFDFVLLTGNPFSGVSNHRIAEAIASCRKQFDGIIIAGKMHAAGIADDIFDREMVQRFIDQGADVLLFPAPATTPGVTVDKLQQICQFTQAQSKLVIGAIGTSQEGSPREVIRQIGLWNKMAGVDIHHIGATGYAGMAPYENIYDLSMAVRGLRHTVRMMGASNDRFRADMNEWD